MATTKQPVSIDLERRRFSVGEQIRLSATGGNNATYEWSVRALSTESPEGARPAIADPTAREVTVDTTALQPGAYELRVVRTEPTAGGGDVVTESDVVLTVEGNPAEVLRHTVERAVGSGVPVVLQQGPRTADQALWSRMRACFERRSFQAYRAFVDRVLCERTREGDDCGRLERSASDCCYRHGVHGYALLKAATEVWLLCHACCGELPGPDGGFEDEFTDFDPIEERERLGHETTAAEMRERLRAYLESSVTPGTLPYIGQILDNLGLRQLTAEGFPFCSTSVRSTPCLFELIYPYWQEEGGLVQTLNAIALRFQNRRVTAGGRDVLANFEIDPLRPLANIFWGYVQEEPHRLSVRRRAYEYEHQYGLRLIGKAVGELDVAERRSKFLEAFHSLLHRAAMFYRDAQNLMMKPDAFPLLEAIRAVHLLLAEGAHNQWGELTPEARQEMMIQQWLLAQPPMREFLQTRAMVPYDEGWMGPVDAMKKVMGWTDVSVIHFHKLATFGERILLSIRFGHWNSVSTSSEQAEAWVRNFKNDLQGYSEAYRAVTGVDLSTPLQAGQSVDATLPAVLLQRRLQAQRSAAR